MWRSVPQIEATLTFTRTSERPKAGILTSRTSAPGAASGLTTASIVPAIIATYDLMPKTRVNTKHTIVALRTRSNLGPVLFSCGPGCRYNRVPCGLAPPHQAGCRGCCWACAGRVVLPGQTAHAELPSTAEQQEFTRRAL